MVSVFARRFGLTLSLSWHPSLSLQTVALVTITFSDFHGQRFWHPWPLTKLCPKDESAVHLEREMDRCIGKVYAEMAGELKGSGPTGCSWDLPGELSEQ